MTHVGASPWDALYCIRVPKCWNNPHYIKTFKNLQKNGKCGNIKEYLCTTFPLEGDKQKNGKCRKEEKTMTNTKRFLATLLALVLILTYLPAIVLAETATTEVVATSESDPGAESLEEEEFEPRWFWEEDQRTGYRPNIYMDVFLADLVNMGQKASAYPKKEEIVINGHTHHVLTAYFDIERGRMYGNTAFSMIENSLPKFKVVKKLPKDSPYLWVNKVLWETVGHYFLEYKSLGYKDVEIQEDGTFVVNGEEIMTFPLHMENEQVYVPVGLAWGALRQVVETLGKPEPPEPSQK